MRISRKYPGFLLFTTLLTAFGIFFALVRLLRSSIEEEISKRGEAIVESFATANAPQLLMFPTDTERVRKSLRFNLLAVAKNPDVLDARVADKSGTIIAATDEAAIGTQMPEYLTRRDALSTYVDSTAHAYHSQAKIRWNEDVLGTFVLTLSRTPLEMAMRRATMHAILFSGGIAAVMCIFALLFVRHEVRPLKVMQVALSAIAKGDFSQRMPEGRSDEIGELTVAFNRMLKRSELFFRYEDKLVIERLIADESLAKPGGRERDISVLFGDMRGYTAMSNRRTADEVVHIVNTYFHLFIECVAQWGGIVDKTMGDAIMVVFEPGEGEAKDGPTRRGVLALAYMKAASRVLNRFLLLKRSTHQQIALEPREWGFAMATGRAIIGNIGSRRRMDYTVCGRVVNLASRLEGLTKNGEVIIDNYTRMSTGELVRSQPLPPVQPKGFSAAEQVIPHRIIGLSDDEGHKLRFFLKKLISFSFLSEMVMPPGLPVGEQQPWCQEAESLVGRVLAEMPVTHFFARADPNSGKLLSEEETGQGAAAQPS